MTDLRALLLSMSSHMAYMQGQLVGGWKSRQGHHRLYDFEDYHWYRESEALRAKVEAALAEPEPEEPTDEELNAICDGTPSLAEIDDLCAKHSFHYEDNDSLECLLLIITDALARWGNHRGILGSSPQPIPVSERLPRPEDCDAEGRVWLYRPQTPILNPYWDLVKMDYIDPEPPPTHWLPFNALPLPSGEVKA